MPEYKCETCNTRFERLSELMRHQRLQGHTLMCHICGKSHTQRKNLDKHLKRHNDEFNCSLCSKVFSNKQSLQRHKNRIHQEGGKAPDSKVFDEDSDPKQYYNLQKTSEKRIHKFNTTNTVYKAHFQDIEVTNVQKILKALKKIFGSLFADITKSAKSDDLIHLTFESSELDYPIVLPFMEKRYLTVERFLSEIERVLQSHEEFVLDNGIEIGIIHAHKPAGSGRKYTNYLEFLQRKQCIIQIKNNDDMCCARAIVTAKAKQENHLNWNSIRLGCDKQRQLAQELHDLADIPIGKCGLNEIKKFQAVLPGYQILVVSLNL